MGYLLCSIQDFGNQYLPPSHFEPHSHHQPYLWLFFVGIQSPWSSRRFARNAQATLGAKTAGYPGVLIW
jgi:hypothetical protein